MNADDRGWRSSSLCTVPPLPPVTAVIVRRIGIEDFTPFARLVYAEAIIMTRRQPKLATMISLPSLSRRTKISPELDLSCRPAIRKPVRVKIQFMHCFMVAVVRFESHTRRSNTVVRYRRLPTDASRGWRHGSTRGPGQIGYRVNSSFLPGMPHPAVVGAQVRKFLPCVAGHAVENRFFTVDHFIMRQRQDEVFGVVVRMPKVEFIVMMLLTINRVELHVHPGCHASSRRVPLATEKPQPAHILRTTGNG